jgi:hypothetical protein
MPDDAPKLWVPGDPLPDDMKEFHFVSWIDGSIAVTSYAVARDVDVLSEEGIDSIVSLGELTPLETGGRHVERIRKFYDKEGAADIRDEAIARAVSVVLRLSSDGKVLVHCAAGVSRSPGVCMLSLCIRDGLGWDEAKRIVTDKRRIANVHPVLEARLTRWLAVNR